MALRILRVVDGPQGVPTIRLAQGDSLSVWHQVVEVHRTSVVFEHDPEAPVLLEIGLGEPLYDKLDADIAYAMMGINAVKGVEIGAGFGVVTQRGTTHGDEITRAGFQSNNAGGVLGGISSGQNIEVTIAIKPTSSIAAPKQSLDIDGNEVEVVTTGRHDPCVGIRATPIAEAMLALVLMDHALRHRAQCGEPKASGEVFKPR